MRRFVIVILFVFVSGVLLACGDQSVVSKSTKADTLPDPGSAGAKILKDNCSQCHGVPSPKVHKADEWPNVVERMQTHRIRKAYGAISLQDEQVLIDYLQQYSAK